MFIMQESANKMREIFLDKVVVNIGIGQNESQVENAKALIKKLTGKEAGIALSKRRDPELKLRKGQAIGALATLRKKEASEMLKKALEANNSTISARAIANNSLNFGVKEYIYISGVKYDPKIGILGMNINASFARPGRRVELRRRRSSRIGKRHREITREELAEYLQSHYNVKIQ